MLIKAIGRTGSLVFVLFMTVCLASPKLSWCGDDPYLDDDIPVEGEIVAGQDKPLADPLEPLNRVFFHFNDRLYFWVLKPVATGYARVLPGDVRQCVRDFFYNLLTPVRVVNNLLQGKWRNTGVELARFSINTTLGVGGLADAAKSDFGLTPRDEDLGQTLGVYGLGEGIYIHWPILGPSTLRDTVGFAGDSFLNPLSYLLAADTGAGIAAYAGRQVNNTSLTLGDYEQFKAAAFDPYIAVRNAYKQYRRNKVRDQDGEKDSTIYSKALPQNLSASEDRSQEHAREEGKARFFVQVGAFIDLDAARQSRDRLRALAGKAVVREYLRPGYRFFGVQVPAGHDFQKAKELEIHLATKGFDETLVVAN